MNPLSLETPTPSCPKRLTLLILSTPTAYPIVWTAAPRPLPSAKNLRSATLAPRAPVLPSGSRLMLALHSNYSGGSHRNCEH